MKFEFKAYIGAIACMFTPVTASAQVYNSRDGSLYTYLNQFSWIAVILLSLLGIALFWVWRKRATARARRDNLIGHISHDDQDLILLMSSIAKTDGMVSAIEVRTISNVFWAITGIELSNEQVEQVIDNADAQFQRGEFRELGKNLSSDQRTILLKSLFEVMVADGKLHAAEDKFVHAVCEHVGITRAVFESVWLDFNDETK